MKSIFILLLIASFSFAQDNSNNTEEKTDSENVEETTEEDDSFGRLTRRARRRRLQNFKDNRKKFQLNVERVDFANERIQAGETRPELATNRVNAGGEPNNLQQDRVQFANDRLPRQRAFDTGARSNNQQFNRVGTGLRSTDFD